MREILFRAKTVPDCKDIMTGKIIKTPKWIYGYVDLGYMHDCGVPIISDEKGNKTYKCQYESIGQFTGLTDKNGKKIFEGDVVDILTENEEIGVITYDEGGFVVKADGFCVDFHNNINGTDLEVIGNIHDNPVYLEKE